MRHNLERAHELFNGEHGQTERFLAASQVIWEAGCQPLPRGSKVMTRERLKAWDRSCFTLLVALMWAMISAGPASEAANYKQWLNEEVVWIISKKEKEEFKKLENDGEREAYIARFWQRRDPTPATQRNEYKEEFYRRLIYVDQDLREGMPGWSRTGAECTFCMGLRMQRVSSGRAPRSARFERSSTPNAIPIRLYGPITSLTMPSTTGGSYAWFSNPAPVPTAQNFALSDSLTASSEQTSSRGISSRRLIRIGWKQMCGTNS